MPIKKTIYDYLLLFIDSFKYWLYLLFLYLDLDKEAFNILLIFMGLNTFSGVLKVLSLDYITFSLRTLILGIVLKFGLLIFPLSVALLSKGIGQDMGVGVVIIVKLLTVSEFISFITNIYMAKTKIYVKDIDVFSIMFHALRNSALLLITKYTSFTITEDTSKDKK